MKKKILLKIFIAIAFLMIIYACVSYVYLQNKLTVDMASPTKTVNTLGVLVVPALLIVGLFHLLLLIRVLKTISPNFFHSLYIVSLTLSGVLLLSDIMLLSDIGKEYLLWDITSQWHLLYGFTAFHIVNMLIGVIYLIKNPSSGEKLFTGSKKSNEALFISLHNISFICGLLGLAGVILSFTGLIIPGRYSIQLMIAATFLALFPFVLIAIYWITRMSKKRIKDWTDEKQLSDSGYGAMLCLAVLLPVFIIISIISLLGSGVVSLPAHFWMLYLPASFWMLLLFFLTLTIYGLTIILRNR